MILIDSNVLISFANENDKNHDKSLDLIRKIKSNYDEIFISDYIFNETMTMILRNTKNQKKTLEFGNHLFKSLGIINIHERVFEIAWKLFQKNNLKFSFTDCTNLALMSSTGIKDIATFDKAFKKVDGINVIDN